MDDSANFELEPYDAKRPYRVAPGDEAGDHRPFAIVEQRFAPGDRVRVCDGVFAGAEGTVLARCRESRLLISVELKQRGVSLEVDDASLELIE